MMRWPDVNSHHESFFRDNDGFKASIENKFRKQCYFVDMAGHQDQSKNQYKGSDEVVFLDVDVIHLTLETCAKAVKVGFKQQDAESYQASKFRAAAAVVMTINWTLSDHNNVNIAKFTSNGFYDSRIRRS